MTINPCCIPLKTGVRMVTHLSMALALAVGWTALKLISISSEVSSNVSTTTSTGVIKPSDSRGGGMIGSSGNVFIEQQPPQSFYNAHIFESHQVPPQYRIPYEYILYHKWHQQQQQMLQQQQQIAAGVDGYHHNVDSQQHHSQQRPYYDDIYSTWYQQQQQRQLQQHLYPSRVERGEGNEFDAFSPTVPIPPPPEHQQEQQQSQSPQQGKKEETEDDEDEHSKIFRSVLHQRKNFKGVGPASSSSSLPPGELTSKPVKLRNSSAEEATTPGNDGARVATAVMPQLQLTSSSKLVPKEREEEQTRERGQVSKDRSSSSPPLLFPLQDGKGSGSGFTFQPAVAAVPAAAGPIQTSSSSRTHLTSSTATRRRQQQQRHNPSSEQQHDEKDNAHEMNRPRAMMLMMSKLAGENPQRGVGYYGGISGRTSSSSKKLFPDFKEQYAKTLLISGLLALCTVVFQFLTSFLLLCFVDKGSNAAAQIWTAVNCSIIFCLATCLVLFLCEGLSMPKYIFDETLYLSLVTIDSILSIYFLWVVMAFI